MLTTERHQHILQLLNEKENITLQDVMEHIKVSESTVRRDLIELEQQEKLVRVHGGATLPIRKSVEYSYREKTVKNVHEKLEISAYAASLVEDGDCIFIDAGTTMTKLIPLLAGKDIVIVTNGLTHVDALMKLNIKTYITGGLMKETTRALIGAQAVESLERYRFDICFLGTNGFHETYGYTTPDPEEAVVKKRASTLAKKTYVLADASKYNRVSFCEALCIEEANLITSVLPTGVLARLEEKTSVKELIS